MPTNSMSAFSNPLLMALEVLIRPQKISSRETRHIRVEIQSANCLGFNPVSSCADSIESIS